MSVDAAINVYGKPFQTAVALLSLLRHSGEHIGKVFVVLEPKQPAGVHFDYLIERLGERAIVHTSEIWHWCDRADESRLSDDAYRRSMRYQFAWEESTADHLFVTHNDMLYHGDLVGDYLANIGDCVAIGEIGQCWNCPASTAGACDGDRYWEFRPSEAELTELYRDYPTNRVGWEPFRDDEQSWPMPECRVNEWAALIDLRKARPVTQPFGDVFPFGGMSLDIGTRWFRQMSYKGFRAKNRPITGLATHSWAAEGSGHQALFDFSRYESGERAAMEMLEGEFGFDRRTLRRAAGNSLRLRFETMMRRFTGK